MIHPLKIGSKPGVHSEFVPERESERARDGGREGGREGGSESEKVRV